MYTREQLTAQIAALGIKPNDTLMIHSSMKAIGEVEGGADTVLDVFMDYLGDEGLLLLPTHSWATMKAEHPVFDPEEEPSCVGILTNLFRKRPGVIRSLHPTHSVAAYGKHAAAYTAGEENFNTPCPPTGCWGRLSDVGAKILFLGCPMARNTFIHSVEEKYDIPNRLTPFFFDFSIRMPDGTLKPYPMRGHQAPCGDISRFYGKLETEFISRGAAYRGTFGDAACILGDAKKMEEITGEHLLEDPDFFLDEKG